MRVFGKEITDTCQNCWNILNCELFLAGHGINQERNRITEMLKCQMDYAEKYNVNGEVDREND